MRRAAEGAPTTMQPLSRLGCARMHPLTVAAPIHAQRMIRDMTGNKEYEFGDGSKALAEGSKEAAEKARGAPSRLVP